MKRAKYYVRAMTFAVIFSDDSILKLCQPHLKTIYENNYFIGGMAFYETSVIISLRVPRFITAIQKLFIDCELKGNITIDRCKRSKIIFNDAVEIWDKGYVIEQIKQQEYQIIVLENGKYVHKEVVNWVLSTILSNMKSHSKTREHEFDLANTRYKLLQAVHSISHNYKCGCNRSNCTEIMQLYGPNGISPDKQNDMIGYSDAKQHITFVVKSHNTRIKPGNIENIAKNPRKWYKILAKSMKNSTKIRVNKLRKKPSQSDFDMEQIKKYDDDDRNTQPNTDHYVQILQQKKLEQKDVCASKGCNKIMYFGNDQELLELSNVAHKVSPDRRNNDNIFYEYDNFDLVCCSCNYTENRAGRTYVQNKVQNNPIFFTPELIQKCKDWLISK